MLAKFPLLASRCLAPSFAIMLSGEVVLGIAAALNTLLFSLVVWAIDLKGLFDIMILFIRGFKSCFNTLEFKELVIK